MSYFQRIKDEVEKLNKNIEENKEKLATFTGLVDKLKNQSSLDQATISKQQKELQALEKKLLECSESREKIQDELREKAIELENKAAELENSKLTRGEINQKIIQLLTIRSSFDGIRKDLLKTWGGYSKTKDDFDGLRDKTLRVKEEGNREAVLSLEKTKKGLWITVFALLAVVVLLSLSLSLSAYHFYKKKKKNNREPSQAPPNNWTSTSLISKEKEPKRKTPYSLRSKKQKPKLKTLKLS